MLKQTSSPKTKTFDINGAKARLAEFDRELESTADLLQQFKRENPFGFNRFLQLTSVIFLTAFFCWLLAYKLADSSSDRTAGEQSYFTLSAAVAVAVIAVGLTLAAARNLFVTVHGWQTMKTLQKTAGRIQKLQAEAQARINRSEQQKYPDSDKYLERSKVI